MSTHDTTQIDIVLDDDLQAPCTAATECDGAQSEGCALDFKISVRKVQVKVQARGVLAE